MKSMNNKILPILKTWLEKHSDAADALVLPFKLVVLFFLLLYVLNIISRRVLVLASLALAVIQ